jgi:hypothetical protein
MENKMFAVIKNNIVVDAWFAKTQEEAESDNLGATIIEMTLENSPMSIGQRYVEEK